MTECTYSGRETLAGRIVANWLASPEAVAQRTEFMRQAVSADAELCSEKVIPITEEQVRALMRLAQGLLTLPRYEPTFSMTEFRRGGESPRSVARSPLPYSSVEPPCGTTACAVGYAPLFLDAPLPEFSPDRVEMAHRWGDFSKKWLGDLPTGLWEWCFDEAWSRIDNSTHGAAARIVHMLANAPSPPYSLPDEDPEAVWLFRGDTEPYEYLLDSGETAQ